LPPDLDVIEADLADVEVALERLDDGEYWRDESTANRSTTRCSSNGRRRGAIPT
jgi:hypothetical protein